MASNDALNIEICTPKEVAEALEVAFMVKRPVFLWGPPGIGKSEIIEQITVDRGGYVIDLRMPLLDVTDIKGMPFYSKSTNTMEWARPGCLPNDDDMLFTDKNPDGMKGMKCIDFPIVTLFLDEMNTASPAVMASGYQLILNRRVGEYKLPDNVVIVAAGNRETDKGVVYRMPTPLSNRFSHLEMKHDYKCWEEWAIANRQDATVIAYLNANKADLYDFKPKSSGRAFATPRSWSFVSDFCAVKGVKDSTLRKLLGGSIGDAMAGKFMATRAIVHKMPNPTDILMGKVKELKIDNVSAHFSLSVSLCYELKEDFEKTKGDDAWYDKFDHFVTFMMDNMTTEIVVMAVRTALVKFELPVIPQKMTQFEKFNKEYGHFIAAALGDIDD